MEEAGTSDVSIVLEKLEGNCLRCAVGATTAETVTFQLAGPLAGVTSLFVWITNSTHAFLQLPAVAVRAGLVTVTLPRDTIITLSTTTGQRKGSASADPGAYAPFPFPYSDDYEDGGEFAPGVFHADNGGTFEVTRSPACASGSQCLLQASPLYPSGTQWTGDFDPITSIGGTDWANYMASVLVLIQAPLPEYARADKDVLAHAPSPDGWLPRYAPEGRAKSTSRLAGPTPDPIATGVYGGICVRQIDQFDSGFCLLVGVGLVTATGAPMAGPGWVLQAGTSNMQRTVGTVLDSGALPAAFNLTAWHKIVLQVRTARK